MSKRINKKPLKSDAFAKLSQLISGEVFPYSDQVSEYARDESILTEIPLAVVQPRDEKDVVQCVIWAKERGISITARGGGSGVAGQAIGEGIILDFSKHMNQVLEVSRSEARVQPGVLLNKLNEVLKKHQTRFLPDPSSRAKCAIGGMIATNASGPKCFRYGSTREHVLDLKVVLADGRVVWTSEMESWFPELVQKVRKGWSPEMQPLKGLRKNSSGYHLAALQEFPPSFTGLMVGSEGTLGLVVEARLKIAPLPSRRFTRVYSFSTIEKALEVLPYIRKQDPVAIELVDSFILGALRKVDASKVQELGLTNASASLWVEWENELPDDFPDFNGTLLSGETSQKILWDLRSEASKALHEEAEEKGRKPLRCIEDIVVPPNRLEEYVVSLRTILKENDCEGAIFGHVGDGHLHTNPMIDILSPGLEERITTLMDRVYALALSMGGSISGEHGDGLLRRKYFRQQWESLLPLFKDVKDALDPEDRFNPGKLWSFEPTPSLPLRDF